MTEKALHILYAEDDLDDCYFLKQAISALSLDIHLTLANDGEVLMAYLSGCAEDLPDVLFLDLNMPRKNGYECLSEIKNIKYYEDLPIVVLSTSNSRTTIDKIFEIGGHIFMSKPDDIGQLRQLIRNVLPIALEHPFTVSPIKYILNAK
jgi:CheY-like chemotaxis protein